MHVDQDEIRRGIEPFFEGLLQSLEYAANAAQISTSINGYWKTFGNGPGIEAELLITLDGPEYRIDFHDTSAGAPFLFAAELAKAEQWVNRTGAESLAPAGD